MKYLAFNLMLARPGRWRQPLYGVLLLSFAWSAIGFPAPRRIAKDDSRPFPCQHHVCGCVDADACQDHCCCFSPSQRKAWNREHGVAPRPHADLAEPREAQNEHAATMQEADTPTACCTHESEPSRASADDDTFALAIGSVQRGCRGLPPLFTMLSQALPAPRASAWRYPWDVFHPVDLASQHAVSGRPQPDVPPPRATL